MLPDHLIPRLAVIFGFHPTLAVMTVETMALVEIGRLDGLRSSDSNFGMSHFKEIPQVYTMAVISQN